MLVEVADLGRFRVVGFGQLGSDGFELGERLVRVPACGEHLTDDETGFEDFAGLVLAG
jgi:hypothetical protein